MTTDDFTAAAAAEARAQWSMRDQHSAFEHGARWARVHLAAQEPSDAELLVAMYAYEGHPDRVSAWRAALTAAWSLRAARRDEKGAP